MYVYTLVYICVCVIVQRKRYISMGLAAECRELCQGVVLVNSAGSSRYTTCPLFWHCKRVTDAPQACSD